MASIRTGTKNAANNLGLARVSAHNRDERRLAETLHQFWLHPAGRAVRPINQFYRTLGKTNIVAESSYRTVYDVTDRLKMSAQGDLRDRRACSEGNRVMSNIYGATTIASPTDLTIDKQRIVRALADWRLIDENDRLFTLSGAVAMSRPSSRGGSGIYTAGISGWPI